MKQAKCKSENCVNYNIFLYNDNWRASEMLNCIHAKYTKKNRITITKLASILRLQATNVPTVYKTGKSKQKLLAFAIRKTSIEHSLLPFRFLCLSLSFYFCPPPLLSFTLSVSLLLSISPTFSSSLSPSPILCIFPSFHFFLPSVRSKTRKGNRGSVKKNKTKNDQTKKEKLIRICVLHAICTRFRAQNSESQNRI